MSTDDADGQPPMPGLEAQVPIENPGQRAMLAVSGICIILPAALVFLRFVAQRRMSRGFDASSFCILAALFFNACLHIDCWVMVLKGGFGFHVVEVAQRFGPGALTLFFKCIMTFALLWSATTLFTKLSILFLYATLFPVRLMVLATRIVGGFLILFCSAAVMAGLAMCQPFARNWDRSIPGHCGDQTLYYTCLGVINIVFEVAILALPMPVIYKLKMPLRRKIGVVALLSVGTSACAITVYRQATLANLDFADMTYSGLAATILSGLEPSVALMLACVPLLRPLFRGGRGGDSSTGASDSGGYQRSGGEGSGLGFISKGRRKRDRQAGLDTLAMATHDDSSDLQLQPLEVANRVDVSSNRDDAAPAGNRGSTAKPSTKDRVSGPQFIKIEKQWEVR